MRRLIATIALSAVFLAPLAGLWCAYTCAADDDGTPTTTGVTVVANASDAVAGGVAIAAHDDCAADLTNRATLATFDERAPHAELQFVSHVAAASPTSIAPALAFHPARFVPSPGSPPGVHSSTVLRI
jgi:hypothetical protein